MRKIMQMRFMLAGFCALFLRGHVVQADIHWCGTSTPDVIDQDLVIDDNSILTNCSQDFVRIRAQTRDVIVRLSQDITIDSSIEVPTLFLEPLNGFNIIFELNHNVQFRGSGLLKNGSKAAIPLNNDLFIFVRGDGCNAPGQVIFKSRGERTLAFTNNHLFGSKGGGGAKLYILMDHEINQTPLIVRFTRDELETDEDKTKNVTIEVGPHGVLGYASQCKLSHAGISELIFEPGNAGSGRMVLSVQDKGSVFISGRKIDRVDPYSDEMNLYAISPCEPAGLEAIFAVNSPKVIGVDTSGLLVLNSNKTLSKFLAWYPSPMLKQTYGFILGNNGLLDIKIGSYFDYVGLAIDVCPDMDLKEMLNESSREHSTGYSNCSMSNCLSHCAMSPESLFKKRNPSAFIIEGSMNHNQRPAIISMAEGNSAIVLRSGVNCRGQVENSLNSQYPFTVAPYNRTPGAGNMVLDVEGCLIVWGNGIGIRSQPTKIEVLSLNVVPTGGSVIIDKGLQTFPKRDFATDENGYVAYNSGYIFVNNYMILNKTYLVHTDQNHKVFERDDVHSEPTYVGGEMHQYLPWANAPKMIFSNSKAYWHTSVALTGLDLLVPNGLRCCPLWPENSLNDCLEKVSSSRQPFQEIFDCKNESSFVYFYNGYGIDNGTGRQMILGTFPGSTSCDCCRVINKNAHLDVMQLSCPACQSAHVLSLGVAKNNDTIINNVPSDTEHQFSINTIYLGNSSNITIGSRAGNIPVNHTNPRLSIDGRYFSFESRGGTSNNPALSNITGEGGIFVDENGMFYVGSCLQGEGFAPGETRDCFLQGNDCICSVNMGVMVTKSGNGLINLPESKVHFGLRTGIANWKLDLNTTPTIIPSGVTISDYSFNWIATCKADGFVPFSPQDCCSCNCVITSENVFGVPTVLGTVDQLKIQGSRIGDSAHIKIGKGGYVRELIFQPGCPSADAPTGVVVLEDGGHVGLGSAHTNADSLYASVVLGVNGVTLIANGNGRVSLNEDLVINNICHIVAGPSFNGHTLRIDSDCCRTIRVKSTGILSFASFKGSDPSENIIQFGGNIKIILEPGARVEWGTCTLQLTDNANIICEPVQIDLIPDTHDSLNDLRDLRIIFGGGPGILQLSDHSYMTVNKNSYLGVESKPFLLGGVCTHNTDLTFQVNDFGVISVLGGSFQVGDPVEGMFPINPPIVNWKLLLDGNEAAFVVGEQGFVGLGAGIVYKDPSSTGVPNDWFVAPTFHVGTITIEILNGILSHNVIRDGASEIGSALVLGSSGTFNLDFTGRAARRTTNVSRSTMRGGGNLVYVTDLAQLSIGDLSTDTVGIMASGPIFNSDNTAFAGTAQELFNFWKFSDINGSTIQLNGRADVGPGKRHEMRIGYVDGGFIQRLTWIPIVGGGSTTAGQDHTFDIGAGGINLIDGDFKPRDIRDIRILA